jgi:hypothetical protein
MTYRHCGVMGCDGDVDRSGLIVGNKPLSLLSDLGVESFDLPSNGGDSIYD